MITIRIRSLPILMVCSMGPVWAQNTLTLDPTSAMGRARSLEESACPYHPNPPAVDVAVDACVDRLVKADVEELPGVRLNPALLPADDPELRATLQAKQPARPAQPPAATSWVVTPANAFVDTVSPAAELTASSAGPLTTVPSPAEIVATEPTDSVDLGSVSALHLKLARARLRRQQERGRRQLVELQKRLEQQCQQLLFTNVECQSKRTGRGTKLTRK